MNSYSQYLSFWNKKKIHHLLELFWTFPLSLISRLLPKLRHELFGSMNGYKICDNSKFLYNNRTKEYCYFITKNKSLINNGDSHIVYAYSFKGILLQLLAKRVHWTHGLNDFIAPLIVGSYIIGLQHGLPGKRPSQLKKQIKYYKVKNLFFPYLYNYYCHEVWSPSERYDNCIKEIFYPLSVIIKRKQLPRIKYQPNLKKINSILYAPSFRQSRTFMDVLEKNNITEESLIEKLNTKGINLVLRPHPLDYEELVKSQKKLPFKIDKSEDIHDTLSSYSLVISDFSGLLIDCWELDINTYCLCDDLEEIYEKNIIFDWFYESLKLVRIHDLSSVIEKINLS